MADQPSGPLGLVYWVYEFNVEEPPMTACGRGTIQSFPDLLSALTLILSRKQTIPFTMDVFRRVAESLYSILSP